MVRRIIGASSAPTPDFSPYKSVTPAAGMTDWYRQPGTMTMPESEFSQVAQALKSISPILNQVVGDQAEAAQATAVTQGRIDAEKLNAEQTREAMRGNFTKMEQSGQIPVGASPFRLAAMQSTLGKKAIQNDLRQILNENLGRFTDAHSTEDPAEFVQEEFTKIVTEQGMGFYAKGAATEALNQVESAFLNRASLLKTENTARQNDEDLTSDIYNSLKVDLPEDMSSEQEAGFRRNQLKTIVDEYYKTTGKSGRPQIVDAITAAAKQLAREGDLEEATNLISVVDQLEIAGDKLEESAGIALDNLRDTVEDLAKAADKNELQDEDNALRRRRMKAEEVADEVYMSMERDDFLTADFGSEERKADITQKLVTAGLSEEDARLAAADTIQKLQGDQRKVPLSIEAAEALNRVIHDDSMTPEEKRSKLVQYRGQLSTEEYLSHLNAISAKGRENVVLGRLDGRSQGETSGLIREVREALKAQGFEDEEAFRVSDGFGQRLAKLRRTIAAQGGTDGDMLEKYRKQAGELRIKLIEELKQNKDKKIPEDTSPLARAAIEDKRKRLAEGEDFTGLPPILKSETAYFVKDTYSTIYMEVLQGKDGEKTPEEVKVAKANIYSETEKRLGEFAQYASRRTDSHGFRHEPGVPPELQPEELRLRMVQGFTLDEIKAKKTALGTPIPEKVLNPRHVIMFPAIKSLSEFKAFVANPDNHETVLGVMKSLPDKFQFGTEEEDIKAFRGLQSNLFLRYRADAQKAK